jgi:hypothetical protein
MTVPAAVETRAMHASTVGCARAGSTAEHREAPRMLAGGTSEAAWWQYIVLDMEWFVAKPVVEGNH